MDSPLAGIPDNGTPPRAKPVLAGDSPAAEAAEAAARAEPVKRGRKRLTADEIEAVKALRAEGKTFKEVASLTGISIGSLQKIMAPAKAPVAKKAAPKGKPGRRPKAAAAPAPQPAALETPTLTAVKLALFDLQMEGHSIAAIRGALASIAL